MTTSYNTLYRLPFPQLEVTFRTDQQSVGPLPALLDTGADSTLAPTHLLKQVGAIDTGWVTIHTHFGDTHLIQRFGLSLEVDGFVIPWVYVVGDDEGDEIILGRDVLNKLSLFLDGPQEQTHLLDNGIAKRLRARRT